MRFRNHCTLKVLGFLILSSSTIEYLTAFWAASFDTLQQQYHVTKDAWSNQPQQEGLRRRTEQGRIPSSSAITNSSSNNREPADSMIESYSKMDNHDDDEEQRIEMIFVAVISMQRSSSTFLSHQVIAGIPHSKADSPINQAPPPTGGCTYRHFVALNEIFTNHPQQSGDAWQVEGAELLKKHEISDPKDLTAEQLADFVQRVALRRCRAQIDQASLNEGASRPIRTNTTTWTTGSNRRHQQNGGTHHDNNCPRDLDHHQCVVTFKHFDFHLSQHDKDKQLWMSLLPQLRVIILERDAVDRWRSFWVANNTGDWNVHGDDSHKAKIAELQRDVPVAPSRFRYKHKNWYSFVRSNFRNSVQGKFVPTMDVAYYDVVARPLQVRREALDLIWNGKSVDPDIVARGGGYVRTKDMHEYPTGSFANASTSYNSSSAVDAVDTTTSGSTDSSTVTVSGMIFAYKVVEESFELGSGRVFVGVLSSGQKVERRHAIRDTWAKLQGGGVFFLVAGPFEDIRSEFELYKDIVWIDSEEGYLKITEKIASFLVLVDQVTAKHGIDYDYVVKVDDDTYFARDRMLARFDAIARENNGLVPDYWGRCNWKQVAVVRDPEIHWWVPEEKYPEYAYPIYCQGGGYSLSKAFVKCAVSQGHIESVRYFDFEDVYVGMLAERCGISSIYNDVDLVRQCRSGWRLEETKRERENIDKTGREVNEADTEWLPQPEMARRIIQHNVFSARDMYAFHSSYLSHQDSALTTIKKGDVVKYYYDVDGVGWLEGTVESITDSEDGSESTQRIPVVSVDFGGKWGLVRGIVFDESYSGRWNRITKPLMEHYLNLEEKSRDIRITDASVEKVMATLSELEKLSIRYYVYDEEEIDQSNVLRKRRKREYIARHLDHGIKDMATEQAVLDALKTHPLRTDDANVAELFVVPTPITELSMRGCQWEGCRWYDDAFDALERHPIFQEHHGNNHVLIAMGWLAFNCRYSAYIPALSRNFRRLRNVTVAHNYDPYGVQDLWDRYSAGQEVARGYEFLYPMELPVTRAFSLGLGYDNESAIRAPTYENFEKSTFFLFYHSRDTNEEVPFAFGTTKYRNAPFNRTVIDSLPNSSIGGPISKEQWLSDFRSSQFCLVVRGDTPHSHALLESVRVGCIPVIVSDDYLEYAGPLKSSLSIDDFSILIQEEDFLHDPLKQLRKLLTLGRDDINNLLKAMAMAQRVLFPDHPQSLHVPAFLRELRSVQQRSPPRLPDAIESATAVTDATLNIQGRGIGIRYAVSTTTRMSRKSEGDNLDIVVAVISKAKHIEQRRAIRATWKQGQSVFFLTYGEKWEDLEQEFMEDGDIVWMNATARNGGDIAESELALLALSFVESFVSDYDYVLKMNDDGGVFLDAAEPLLRENAHDYWGFCPKPHDERYKNYGYFISRKLNQCLLGKESDSVALSRNDGVATRLLADSCGVSCNNTGWEWVGNKTRSDLWFMDDHMSSSRDMLFLYWSFMRDRKIGEWMTGSPH